MARKPDISHYERYVQGGSWKCSESPTGAHHWLLHDTVWVCKYCGDARKMPKTFAEAMAQQHPGGVYPMTLEPSEQGIADRNKVPMKPHKWRAKW